MNARRCFVLGLVVLVAVTVARFAGGRRTDGRLDDL